MLPHYRPNMLAQRSRMQIIQSHTRVSSSAGAPRGASMLQASHSSPAQQDVTHQAVYLYELYLVASSHACMHARPSKALGAVQYFAATFLLQMASRKQKSSPLKQKMASHVVSGAQVVITSTKAQVVTTKSKDVFIHKTRLISCIFGDNITSSTIKYAPSSVCIVVQSN